MPDAIDAERETRKACDGLRISKGRRGAVIGRLAAASRGVDQLAVDQCARRHGADGVDVQCELAAM